MADNIQQKLNALRLEYQKKLPSKIDEILRQWQSLLEQWDEQAAIDLHREVHSLCGSSGTYGYIDLSKIARKAEIIFKKIPSDKEGSYLEKEKISSLLMQLKDCALNQPDQMPENTNVESLKSRTKIVYILEEDKILTKEVHRVLTNLGYKPYVLDSLATLAIAIKEEPPVAIIVNSSYLDSEGIALLKTRPQTEQTIQLFCFIPNSKLLPRLQAVRANCDAFFQFPIDTNYFTQVFQSKCGTSAESFRVLIVDDSENLAEYYSLILIRAGMITKTLNNPMNLLDEIKLFQPDLILMDIYMPDCTGLELAAVLRHEMNYTKIPIIFLSTEDDRSKIMFAISVGGDDFLSKPVSPGHLISAVRSRAKRASVLNYYMMTDSLTGLLNHSSVLAQLELELVRVKLNKGDLTIIMIDIDFFKKINDQYGHPAGDKVLKQLANLFLVSLRKQDIIGRYGGEEFLIILPHTPLQNGVLICEKLRLLFAQFPFYEQTKTFHSTFSAGVSYLRKEESGHALIKEADRALYEAKKNGRNQVIIFNK